jgi:hypothetical protein
MRPFRTQAKSGLRNLTESPDTRLSGATLTLSSVSRLRASPRGWGIQPSLGQRGLYSWTMPPKELVAKRSGASGAIGGHSCAQGVMDQIATTTPLC